MNIRRFPVPEISSKGEARRSGRLRASVLEPPNRNERSLNVPKNT
jgi:hypothetical protein